MQPSLKGETLTERGGDSLMEAPAAPHLFLVLEAARPLAGPARHSLLNIDEVIIGRSAARTAQRIAEGGSGRLELGVPDPHISARHARLHRVGESWALEDLGSSNGTRLNGAPVERATLRDGAWIQVGRTILRLRTALPTAPTTPGDVDLGAEEARERATALTTILPDLAAAFAPLSRMARSRVPVLLLGETGSGKELLARAIHERSGRAGALVAVNCGAIPSSLLEAQLFGHVKGAFSGATRDELGFARAADGGTLFLDEIGDLALPSQVALLRLLQEGEVVPVGTTRPVSVDLRVVSATHAPIEALVERGTFREDLLARLSGYRFTARPLRERMEDVGLMIGTMLRELGGDNAEPGPWTLEPPAAWALLRYAWPRNVRELRQCLAAAAVLATDHCVRLSHLPAKLHAPEALGSTGVPSAPPARAAVGGGELVESDEALREALVAALTECEGNISEVARRMGKARVQIHRWMKRFAIDPLSFRP